MAIKLFGNHMANAGVCPGDFFEALRNSKQLGKGFYVAAVQTERSSPGGSAVGSPACRAILPPCLPGVGEQVARHLPASLRSDVVYVPGHKVPSAGRFMRKRFLKSSRHVALILIVVETDDVVYLRYDPEFDASCPELHAEWWNARLTKVKLREIAKLLLSSEGMCAPTSSEERSICEAAVADIAANLADWAENRRIEYQHWRIMRCWGVVDTMDEAAWIEMIETPWQSVLDSLDLSPETRAVGRNLREALAAEDHEDDDDGEDDKSEEEEDEEEGEDRDGEDFWDGQLCYNCQMHCAVQAIVKENGNAQETDKTTVDEPGLVQKRGETGQTGRAGRANAESSASSQTTIQIEAAIAQANAAVRQQKEATKRNHKKLQVPSASTSERPPVAAQASAALPEKAVPEKTRNSSNAKASKGIKTRQLGSLDFAANREMWKLRCLARSHLDTAPVLNSHEPTVTRRKRVRKAPQGDAKLARRLAAAELLE